MRKLIVCCVLILSALTGARLRVDQTLQAGDTVHCAADVLQPTSPLDAVCVAFSPTPTETPTVTATNTATPAATPTATATPTNTPTATPTNTATPSATTTATPSGPIRATFFYPWFPQSWTQLGVFPYTHYQPTLGYYASADDTVIDNQVAAMRYAHLDAAISSWWGPGHNTDTAFAHILTRTAPFRWSLYYEAEGQTNPTAATIASDLAYLDRYFAAPNYLRIGNAPVLFVYADPTDGCGMADRWNAAKTLYGKPLLVVLKVFSGYTTCTQPDSWHQYSPAVGYDQQAQYSAVVSPGFWKSGESVRLARDLTRFSADLARMVASSARWQLVTTWNEWGEGSGVESTQEFGEAYLDRLCRALPGTTPCTPVADPIIAAAGDIACGPTTTRTATTCRDTSPLLQNAAAILTLGDNQYEQGELSNFNSFYGSTWGRLLNLTHPSVGNHEYLTAGAAGYYSYFGVRAGDPTKGYYSFDIGAWHLIALNSQCSEVGGCGAGSPQETWLKADLAAHPACTLAYWHIPRFSSGQHGNNSAYSAFWNDLYAANADIVLNGHDHDYERFAKQSPAALPGGIREFVVGTGGKNHYGFTTVQPNSEIRNADTYGVLKLTLHPASYDWQFVPETGHLFTDQGSDAC